MYTLEHENKKDESKSVANHQPTGSLYKKLQNGLGRVFAQSSFEESNSPREKASFEWNLPDQVDDDRNVDDEKICSLAFCSDGTPLTPETITAILETTRQRLSFLCQYGKIEKASYSTELKENIRKHVWYNTENTLEHYAASWKRRTREKYEENVTGTVFLKFWLLLLAHTVTRITSHFDSTLYKDEFDWFTQDLSTRKFWSRGQVPPSAKKYLGRDSNEKQYNLGSATCDCKHTCSCVICADDETRIREFMVEHKAVHVLNFTQGQLTKAKARSKDKQETPVEKQQTPVAYARYLIIQHREEARLLDQSTDLLIKAAVARTTLDAYASRLQQNLAATMRLDDYPLQHVLNERLLPGTLNNLATFSRAYDCVECDLTSSWQGVLDEMYETYKSYAKFANTWQTKSEEPGFGNNAIMPAAQTKPIADKVTAKSKGKGSNVKSSKRKAQMKTGVKFGPPENLPTCNAYAQYYRLRWLLRILHAEMYSVNTAHNSVQELNRCVRQKHTTTVHALHVASSRQLPDYTSGNEEYLYDWPSIVDTNLVVD
jgi:hypothetical protein